MPNVRAILVSDVHLQLRPPVARSCEPDWFEAMARSLDEIYDLAQKYVCPILYSGDIFDKWNSNPELINFAVESLPNGFAIPGQHDLPNHNYTDMKKSAYWTLVCADVIQNLSPRVPTAVSKNVLVWGFPWGFEVESLDKEFEHSTMMKVALIHKFIWTDSTGYQGADSNARIESYKRALHGYDVAVFGDNHKGFIGKSGNTVVCNCGGLMRRKTDERDYQPGVGLLLEDGTVRRHYLDTSEDKFIELTKEAIAVEQMLDMSEFIKELEGLGTSDALDFEAAIKRFFSSNDVSERARQIILAECVGEVCK